jgi:uncharacterized membrane protein YjjB (DUF3815 family)
MSLWEIAQQGFWAFVATAGFAVLFNVPRRAIVFCGLNGAIGIMCRRALLENDIHAVTSTFCGAMTVGFCGYFLARLFHRPRLIFTVTGIIPMVPGVLAFETVVYFMRDDITTGVETAVRAILLVGAIGAGLMTMRLTLELGSRATQNAPITRGIWWRD